MLSIHVALIIRTCRRSLPANQSIAYARVRYVFIILGLLVGEVLETSWLI